jgi:hypothetical protein
MFDINKVIFLFIINYLFNFYFPTQFNIGFYFNNDYLFKIQQ